MYQVDFQNQRVVYLVLLVIGFTMLFAGRSHAQKVPQNALSAPSTAAVLSSNCPTELPYYAQDVTVPAAVPPMPVSLNNFYSNMASTNGTSTARKDYSGITHNILLDDLLVIDNKDKVVDVYNATTDMFERTVSIQITSQHPEGKLDLEDLAWMGGDRYALLDEWSGKVHVVTIDETQTTVTDNDIDYTIDTCMPAINKDGFEGLTVAFWSLGTNAEFFYLVWEGGSSGLPPQVYEFRRFKDNDADPSNNPVYRFGPLDLSNAIDDAAAIYTPLVGDFLNLYVLSDDSTKIVQIDSFYSGNVIAEYDFSANDNFGQPEGLTFDLTMTKMYVVGESRQLGTYTIQ